MKNTYPGGIKICYFIFRGVMGKHRKIEIGQRYDRLKIIEDLGVLPYKSSGRKFRTYRCLCDCGNIIDLPGVYIGRAWKSCGCLQRESREKVIAPGTMFGRLKVLEKGMAIPNRGYAYICECQCAKKTILSVRGDRLRSGEAQSCGCLHDELLREHCKKAYSNNFVGNTNVPRIAYDKLQKNNTSGVRGVTWHKGVCKWQAGIDFKGKHYHLGYYLDIAQAKKARESAEKELHGQFLEWYAENYPAQWRKIEKRRSKT